MYWLLVYSNLYHSVPIRAAAEDFVPLDEVVVFTPGEVRKCVNIEILDDNIEEGDTAEIFSVQVLAAPGEGNIGVDIQLLQVFIVDSDCKHNYTASIYCILAIS